MAANAMVGLSDAEHLVGRREFDKALDILRTLDGNAGLVRRLLRECCSELGLSSELIERLYPPVSGVEAIVLADALWERGEQHKLREMLASDLVAKSIDPSVTGIRDTYSSKLGGVDS